MKEVHYLSYVTAFDNISICCSHLQGSAQMDFYGIPTRCAFSCVYGKSGDENENESCYTICIGSYLREKLDECMRNLPLTLRSLAIRAWGDRPFRLIMQKTPFEGNRCFLTEPHWALSFAASDTPPSTEFLLDSESNEKNTIAVVYNKAPVMIVGENLKLFVLFYNADGVPKFNITVDADFFAGHQETSAANRSGKKVPLITSASLIANATRLSRATTVVPKDAKKNKPLKKKSNTKKKGKKSVKTSSKKSKRQKKEKGGQMESFASPSEIANRLAELQSKIKL